MVSKSICKKEFTLENTENIFTFENADIARKECADLGREVCGVCISHLYTTYE